MSSLYLCKLVMRNKDKDIKKRYIIIYLPLVGPLLDNKILILILILDKKRQRWRRD